MRVLSYVLSCVLSSSCLLLNIDKFKQVLNSHVEHFCDIHSQFKGWIISSIFQMDDRFPSCADKLGQFALLISRLLPVCFYFGYQHDQAPFASI